MNERRKIFLSEMSIFLLAMIWGGTFVAGKITMETLPFEWILVIRFFISSILMGLIFFKEWKNCTRETIKIGVILGFFLFLGVSIQMTGLRYTTPAKQSFLLVSYVIMVPMVHWLINGIRPEKKIFIAGILCLIGVGLLSLNEELKLGFGDSLTLLYALIFSFQLVLVSKYAKTSSPPVLFTIIQIFMAGIFSLALVTIFKIPLDLSKVNQSSWWGLFYLTVLNTAIAYTIQNVAQKYARPTNTALIMATESVFGGIAAVLFVGEVFTPKKFLGCTLIFIAILLAQWQPKLVDEQKAIGKS
ncbi:MAG: DMT family transporter [Tissierellia bacterium]|nr:DMT family transporter [Tissierellia bacterium]